MASKEVCVVDAAADVVDFAEVVSVAVVASEVGVVAVAEAGLASFH